MTQRKEEFPPDGKRIKVEPRQVIDAWKLRCKLIPAQYAVATAQHESNFSINEIDTEPNGFVSKGIFQLSDDEAHSVGFGHCNLLQLPDSVAVMAALSERRLATIMDAVQCIWPPPEDAWFYLAIAHNQGMGACLKTIKQYGMDWRKYVVRNAEHKNWTSYYSDCITGGPSWPKSS